MLWIMLGWFGMEGISHALKTQSGKGKANEYGVYKDGNGHLRLQSNGRRVVDTWNKDGDYVIKYINNGATVINITLQEANKRKEEAIRKGKLFYLRQKENGCRGKLGNEKIYGSRYCNIDNPNIYYVKRFINYTFENNKKYFGEFYMDMNKKLICPTEKQVSIDKQYYPENDNNILYDTIIDKWKYYILNNTINVDYNTCILLNNASKKDYKIYTDKINRWKY